MINIVNYEKFACLENLE